jgi:hypothetical protein
LTIESKQPISNNIEVYDVLGKLLTTFYTSGETKFTLDISHLANGVYFVKVNGEMVKIEKE